ncbi:Serine/threonine-protein kinase CtkA [Fusobacterium necrophorum]|nr:HipA domain-containing protein [Fusobacterium necrophorum]MBR8733066.1 Serine/threonine-protein kinase CtkA [Fusobacterium necrophorum]MBR8789390.1 Serine/threonine-protein kinase CtkA [Fusobacterium necrophorum]
MIQFNECEKNLFRGYDGANGEKISIYYNEKVYMLKFPSLNPNTNEETTSSIHEHIACVIAKELGLNSQNTILGKYNDKVVVACEDFEVDGFKLLNFTSVKNSLIDSKRLGRGLELDSILYTIENQEYVDKKELKTFFWDMFILDSLTANGDRHNGNWGILTNEKERICKIAPIYDCGSSFHTHFNEKEMENIMYRNPNTLNNLVMGNPRSAIQVKNKGINYYNFLTQTDNADCLSSLKKITARIDLEKINKMIMKIPYISDTHKKFISTILKERKGKILEKALELNENIEKSKENS